MLVAVAARSASIAQFVARWHHEQSGAATTATHTDVGSAAEERGHEQAEAADTELKIPSVDVEEGEAEDAEEQPAVSSEQCMKDVKQWLSEEEERGRKRRDSPELNMTFFLHVPRTAGRCASR